MYRFGDNGEMTREGGNPWGANENPLVEYRYLYGDYLKALGIPVLRGRALDSRDGAEHQRRARSTRRWPTSSGPSEDPIGKRFGQGTDLKTLLHRRRRHRQHPLVRPGGEVAVRVLSDDRPGAAQRDDGRAAIVRRRAVRRSIPSARAIVATPRSEPAGDRRADDGGGGERVGGAAAAAVGAVGAVRRAWPGLLAMVGVYGVTSYNVRRQRREYGIRLALGADPGAVRRLIVRRGAVVAVGRHRDRRRRRPAA